MSDQIKFRKMLEILLLLSGNFGYSITEIADKFEINVDRLKIKKD